MMILNQIYVSLVSFHLFVLNSNPNDFYKTDFCKGLYSLQQSDKITFSVKALTLGMLDFYLLLEEVGDSELVLHQLK